MKARLSLNSQPVLLLLTARDYRSAVQHELCFLSNQTDLYSGAWQASLWHNYPSVNTTSHPTAFFTSDSQLYLLSAMSPLPWIYLCLRMALWRATSEHGLLCLYFLLLIPFWPQRNSFCGHLICIIVFCWSFFCEIIYNFTYLTELSYIPPLLSSWRQKVCV